MDRARRTRAGAAAGLFAALCPCAWALNPALDISQYAHTAWTIRDGFFDSPIQTIAQTPDGYLWLGTEFGLFRFDGVRKVAWNPLGSERLPSANVLKLLATRDGRLWIGTAAGLVSWKDGRLMRYPEIPEQPIAALAEGHEGTVWVGTWAPPSGRLCAIRKGAAECYGQDGSLGWGVLSLFEEDGNLWAGSHSGLWRWKPDPRKRYVDPEPTMGFNDFIKSDDGHLLVGRPAGLRQLVSDKIEPFPIGTGARPPTIRTVLRDRSGGVWIGTRGRGLVHLYKGRTDRFNRLDGLSGDDVVVLFEDREGNIWAATNQGLDRFRDFAIATMSSGQGLASDGVGAVLAARDGSVWIGGIGGLSRWKNGQITVYRQRDGLPDDTPQSLSEDSRGKIWVSTRRGFAYSEDGRFVPLRSATTPPFGLIAEGADGSLWVTLASGLIHLVGEEVVERVPLPTLGYKDNVVFLAGDAKHGGIWLGFLHGGLVFFKDGQIRESYGTAQGLGAGFVTGVYPQPDGSIWAATEGGLSRIQDGHVATLNSRNGLPCDSVRAVIEDDEHAVWLYLACGMVRISRDEFEAWTADTKRPVRSAIFDASDGAAKQTAWGPVPRAARLKNGQLWFSNGTGVLMVDPRHLAENKVPPPVHIEEIVANDKTVWQNLTPVSPANPRLPALTHRLEFRYTALSFAAPEKIHFKYKLEGYDRDWMEVVNKREVEYTNLPPRNYRFRVIASNNSGLWNETGDTLEFSIAPAYYQTNWFRALVAATVLVLMGLFYQLRVLRAQRESRRLRDVIETIPAYVWSAQPDGSVDFVNRRWLEFSGFSLDQAKGWGWAEALHPEDRDGFVEGWRAAVASGKAVDAEARVRGADGEYRWLLFRNVPQRDRSGKIVKWYGKSMDITELKRAEEERERMHELETDLAHMNRVSMMGELSASIAHEVNQPLTGIVSNGSACLRWLGTDGPIAAPDAEEVREAVRDMVRDGKRAGDIIRRIRALTKRTELPREKLDLNETIREVLALVGDEARKNHVTVRTQFADEVFPVHGDRVQLQQVLLNLVMNAIQAMSGVTDRARQLVISTRTVDQNRLEVTVEDSGIGLDPEKIARIFEPFYTTKSGGMGMGLSICRSILEHHGGKLWATANDGPGASFHFALPKSKGEETNAGAAAD